MAGDTYFSRHFTIRNRTDAACRYDLVFVREGELILL